MSGHNKWSTIKRKKGALDSKRSKIFSRIVKEIAVAVKEAGPNPDGNPRLRLAIQNAKGVNMPKDNINRAITKAEGDGTNFQEYTFEGVSVGGVGIFVECLTDNHKRTVSNIRSCFTKRGGELGVNGSLKFIFERKGVFEIPKENIKSIEEFELEVIDAGAEDISMEDEIVTVTTAMEDFKNMQKKLESLEIEVESAELRRIPNSLKQLSPEVGKQVLRLVDMLEDDDDVQNVFHNLEITPEIEALMEE